LEDFVTKDKARELHGQNSEFSHSRINLEEQVEKMFMEEYTAQQMEDVWSNGRALWYGGVGEGGAFFTRYPIATKSGEEPYIRLLGTIPLVWDFPNDMEGNDRALQDIVSANSQPGGRQRVYI
jgi:hypothetical protein